MKVRHAEDSDLSGILSIYNEVIANSTAIYTNDPVTLEDRATWLSGRQSQGYPVLVAVDGTGVAGFASFGDFRAWPCYSRTVEHSIHVRQDCRGTGVGSALMLPLFEIAAELRKHVMIAGVDAANSGSLRFHEKHGFEQAGHFREVGYKFGRWLDLVFLQRWLTPPSAA